MTMGLFVELFTLAATIPVSTLVERALATSFRAIKTIIFSSFHRIFLEKNIVFFCSGNFEALGFHHIFYPYVFG